jgi:hypothetical protein
MMMPRGAKEVPGGWEIEWEPPMVGEEYVGGLQMPLDQSMLWPEAFADFATRVVTDKKTGKTSPFNAAHKTYAMKMELPLQRVTPEMVDQYMLGVERAKARGLLD